ncbi:MAG: hypothetical protein ACHBN1_11615 [Heteroscytonema crispum UTEX LB 1556]
MHTPENVQVGDKVLILRPAYVAGKIGVVCGREVVSGGQPSNRWLIQVDCDNFSDNFSDNISENIVVSLTKNEFQVIRQGKQ